MTDTGPAGPAGPAPSTVIIAPPAPPPKPPPPSGAVATTAVAALSGAGAGDTILWIFECFNQHKVVTPETDLATIWGAALMPIMVALYQKFLKRIM